MVQKSLYMVLVNNQQHDILLSHTVLCYFAKKKRSLLLNTKRKCLKNKKYSKI